MRGFKGDLEVDLEGEVWFSLELKFNSFELGSEVGRLVCFVFDLLFQDQ